jgi:TonB family protein
MTRITLGLALLLALAAPAAAQSGRIHGVVADQSGAVLPAVEIRATMRDNSGETTRSVKTDGKGSYELGSLSPGVWALTMTVPGFETATRRVTVQADDSLEWSATLEIGSIQETVTITTGASDSPQRQEAPRRPVQAPPPPPPAPVPAGLVRVGGSIKPPRKVVNVNPVYPTDAASQGLEGVVILRAVIGTDGFVRDITQLRSPNESLALAATGAFNEWQFTPTLLNGVPVATRIIATFNFKKAF